MIQRTSHFLKYHSETPLTVLAALTTVSLVAFSIIIALHGTYGHAFQRQNICMLSLMTLTSASFISFCVLLASKKSYNNQEMVTHFFENPSAYIKVHQLDSVLPPPLLRIISDYSAREEQWSFLMHFGISTTDLKEDFVQLCRAVDRHKSLFLPLDRGLPGVLSFPHLSLQDACLIIAKGPAEGRALSLAIRLLLTPHEAALFSEGFVNFLMQDRSNFSLTNLTARVLKTNDVGAVRLYSLALHINDRFDESMLLNSMNEDVFIFLLERAGAGYFINNVTISHACLMGWKAGFVKSYMGCGYIRGSDEFWRYLLIGAFLHKHLKAHHSLGAYAVQPKVREFCPDPEQFLACSGGNYEEVATELRKRFAPPTFPLDFRGFHPAGSVTPQAFCAHHDLKGLLLEALR